MSDVVLETHALTKRYGRKVGCEDISLSVRRGSVFGFLGRNGAGKSTFVKTMMGLMQPTSGAATLLGKPIGDPESRRRVGYLPEVFRYQEWLTPKELLAFHAKIIGMPPADVPRCIHEVLEAVGLGREREMRLRSFSKGMQQRFGLACALLGDPEVVFLDEPTSALDPVGRAHVRELLVHVRDRGGCVFLNSHLLSEVEMVCDEVAFIAEGRVVDAGPLDRLLKGGCEVDVGLRERLPLAATRLAEDGFDVLAEEDRGLTVAVEDEDAVPRLVERLVAHGARIESVAGRKRSLESLFLERVGERKESA